MTDYQYTPRGVCAKQIYFSIDDGKLSNVAFMGGCSGNLKAIGKLLEGADAEQTVHLLSGNTCGRRSTSCADQLTIAIQKALAH